MAEGVRRVERKPGGGGVKINVFSFANARNASSRFALATFWFCQKLSYLVEVRGIRIGCRDADAGAGAGGEVRWCLP